MPADVRGKLIWTLNAWLPVLVAGGLVVATGGVSLLGKELLDRVVSEAVDCAPANASANAPLFALIVRCLTPPSLRNKTV